jgi:hypothetical protein
MSAFLPLHKPFGRTRRRSLRAGLLAAVALLLTAPAAQAQRSFSWGEVIVSGGYGPAQLRWKTFEEFLGSYSKVNQKVLPKAVKLGMGSTQSVGALFVGNAYIGYQRTAANLTAEFTGGSERRFGVRQGLCVISIEPRFFIGSHYFLAPTGALCFGQTRLNVTYKYPDGTETWGNDRRLNGEYTSTSFTSMAGVKTGVIFGPLMVQVKGDYLFAGKGGTGLGDLPGLGTNNQLPRHYDQFLKATSSFSDPYSLTDDAVRDDLGMIRIAVEVGLVINGGGND